MNNKIILAALIGCALVACDRPNDQRNRPANTEDTREVDNTGRNTRDRDFNTPTSGSQRENDQDLTITQNIRKALLDEDDLSMNAKNIKIITQNGVVTLRGVAESTQEKDLIAQKVKSVQGVKNVENHIEVRRRA